MSWNPPGLWATVVISIGGGFLAGLVLLGLQWVWNAFGKSRRRRQEIKALQEFFQEWEAEIIAANWDEDLRFARHEQRIRRMKDHLTSIRPNLPDREWSEITAFIRRHEELIKERLLVLRSEDPDFPRRFLLMDDDYRNFFKQSIQIKWLKPGRAKSRKRTKTS